MSKNKLDQQAVQEALDELLSSGLTPLEYMVAIYRGDVISLGIQDKFDALLSLEIKKLSRYYQKEIPNALPEEIQVEAEFNVLKKLFPPMHRMICAKEVAPYLHPKIASTLTLKVEDSLSAKLEQANKRVMRTIEGRAEVVSDE